MTVTEELALGISINSPRLMPKACAIRSVTASVGLACSRSMSLSIDRLTPLAFASASKDQPRALRKSFTRAPRWRLIESDVCAGACCFTRFISSSIESFLHSTQTKQYWGGHLASLSPQRGRGIEGEG